MKKEENYVLITGAGAGLGRCFALELAKKGFSVALASLMQEELDAVAAEVKNLYPAIQVKTLAVDMLQPQAANTICQWLDAEKIQLAGLVNNVGFGYTGNYESMDEGFLNRLLQLNVIFTHNLTYKVVPRLVSRPAFILNVASMAAHFPLPYKTLYSASKSFVLSFSNSLRNELKERRIQVSCLCPGPMVTNNEVRERIKNIGWRRHIVNVSEPEKIARKGIRGVERNKAVIFPTFNDKLTIGIKAILPAALLSAIINRLSRNSF